MALVESGNKMPLGSGAGQASGPVDECISKTKDLAFPSGPVISLENFEGKGDRQGYINTLADMQGLAGKTLQESYRAGLSDSAKYTQKVSDR